MLRTAIADGGITFVTEKTAQAHLASGALVSILEDFLPSLPEFHLFFPHRRNMAPKLRALIDHIRHVSRGEARYPTR